MSTIQRFHRFLFFMIVIGLASIATADETEPGSTFATVVEHYLAIQSSLANDSLDGVRDHAFAIGVSAATLADDFAPSRAGVGAGSEDEMLALLPVIERTSAILAAEESIGDVRAAFGDLSDAVIGYRNLVVGDVPEVAYCGMAKKFWLQDGKTIANPYFGASMLRCGSIVEDDS